MDGWVYNRYNKTFTNNLSGMYIAVLCKILFCYMSENFRSPNVGKRKGMVLFFT